MKEQWKWINGYEGLYEVSNLGHIQHHKKRVKVTNSKGWYLTYRLFKDGKWETVRIHRCVYEAFIGEIPKGYHVHHIDGNKQNNVISNLQALTVKEHMSMTANNPAVYGAMVNKNRFGQKHILQFTLDGKFIQEHINAKEAEKVTGVCSRNINQVANKAPYNARGSIRKQAGGFIWKYKEKGVVK